jgi:hypothetical protein
MPDTKAITQCHSDLNPNYNIDFGASNSNNSNNLKVNVDGGAADGNQTVEAVVLAADGLRIARKLWCQSKGTSEDK